MPNAPHLDNGAAGRDSWADIVETGCGMLHPWGAAGRDGAGGDGGDADADVGEDHCCHALPAEGWVRNHFVITAVIVIATAVAVVGPARGAIASAFRLTRAAGAVR